VGGYNPAQLAWYEAKLQAQNRDWLQGPQGGAAGYKAYAKKALADKLADLALKTISTEPWQNIPSGLTANC
jgi:hypothetical protein